MSDLAERISRFEHMAAAYPENDMAHFSLGNAYLQAGRHAEAAASLERCLELNPAMSKAFQLAGEAMIKAGWKDKAVATLEQGYEVAAARGDLLPRDAMAELLTSIGRTPPKLSADVVEAAERLRAGGAFVCATTGRPGTQLQEPPLPGSIGQWILDHVSAETWRDWVGQGTKVINELRLDFSKDADQATYEQHMVEYLGVPPEVAGGG